MSQSLAVVFVVAAISVQSDTSTQADRLVRQLRELPSPIPTAITRSDGRIDPVEQRRRDLYRQLRGLGNDGLPALARGLRDPNVQLRKSVALALNALAGSWFDASEPKLNIRAILASVTNALQDTDSDVRAWVAQAIGQIGPDAVDAVPALIGLLEMSDEGSRNSACLGLSGIGPPATAALPALRRALSDPSVDVRRFAQRAIEKIEGR